MTPRKVTLTTTMYGKRLVTVADLYRLHREVSSAAAKARANDPEWRALLETGKAVARARVV